VESRGVEPLSKQCYHWSSTCLLFYYLSAVDRN